MKKRFDRLHSNRILYQGLFKSHKKIWIDRKQCHTSDLGWMFGHVASSIFFFFSQRKSKYKMQSMQFYPLWWIQGNLIVSNNIKLLSILYCVSLSLHHTSFHIPPFTATKAFSLVQDSLAYPQHFLLYSSGWSTNSVATSPSNGWSGSGSHKNLRNWAHTFLTFKVGPHPSPVSMASHISPVVDLMLGW